MNQPEDTPTSIDFHYIKSHSFRVVHGDGVWGGATPRGYIAMSFFSERSPIPQTLTHDITPQGNLGEETNRQVKSGVVREVEVEVIVDLATAKGMLGWLETHISAIEDHNKAITTS